MNIECEVLVKNGPAYLGEFISFILCSDVLVFKIRIFFVLLEVLGVGGSLGASFAKEGDYLVFEGITVLEKL